jgi:DNA polymerase-3 subunit chi
MGEAYFYHLTESPLEGVLPLLLSRARGQGWRVELRGCATGRMAALDLALWRGDGFLAHGLEGGPHDAMQQILLTTRAAGAGFDCVMAVDGAEVAPEEIAGLARAMILFDGNDIEAVEQARGQWRLLTGAGAGAKYWAQEDGRWVMKAEKA